MDHNMEEMVKRLMKEGMSDIMSAVNWSIEGPSTRRWDIKKWRKALERINVL